MVRDIEVFAYEDDNLLVVRGVHQVLVSEQVL